MTDLEQRVDVLEKKVKLLEETLETLKNMNLSEQMEGYIQARSRAVKMVDLLNQVSDEPGLDFEQERQNLERIITSKTKVDNQISHALQNTKVFSDAFPDNPKYFDYEIETGYVTENDWDNSQKRYLNLSGFANKGLRIIGYNGFDSDRVIVPKEINGQPVISIGERAFKNATFSELILPKSIRAILRNAFEGCENLSHITFPDRVVYMGKHCFSKSGLEEFNCPDSTLIIQEGCFEDCKKLSRVHLGNQLSLIERNTFSGCKELRKISLPESLKSIESKSFMGTGINAMLFPAKLEKVSYDAFSNIGITMGSKIVCAFLGAETIVESRPYETFNIVSLIFCLPGSKIQKYAREHNIPIKPLSEFKWEDYE